jgi:nucleoid DNA-binding protein
LVIGPEASEEHRSMTYKMLVNTVAVQSGHPTELVRDVLLALPNVLLGLKEGEQVRTPLGVFRMVLRNAREVVSPRGGQRMTIEHGLVCKLKAGVRLRKQPVT